MQFYFLIQLLAGEAKLVTITAELLTKGHVYRYQRKESKEVQAGIITLWRSYKEVSNTATQLLKDISFCIHRFVIFDSNLLFLILLIIVDVC